MPKEPPEIKVLPVDVASRIAAGEVIERPASALKEMLENSIDAGAERVEIDFSRGGKSYIKIADDGCGMTRSQALASLEQHATSKIADADDIFAISTYGFRGEAVPSIASVSKFTMRTRPHSAETGTRIDVEAGRVLEVRECGMPCGTEIFVEDLFCSVPARRKFLKSDNVEASHIVRLCKLYAMALPNLRLRLSEDSREIFSSEGGVGVMERIRAIYGAPMADAMIELPESRARGMSLYGAVLKPGESFATGRGISLFINSRPVDCKAAFLALKDAYAQLVPKGRYPAAFLFLDMNPRDVDVNVHPAKREVRLKDEFDVRDFILGAVSDRLARYSFELREGRAGAVSGGFGGAAAQAGGAGTVGGANLKGGSSPRFFSESSREPHLGGASAARESGEGLNALPGAGNGNCGGGAGEIEARTDGSGDALSGFLKPALKPEIRPPETFGARVQPRAVADSRLSVQARAGGFSPCAGWRLIGFFQRKYALYETEKSLVLMSISAALKRVTYARIMGEGFEKVSSQKLLIPANLNFERADSECFEANLEAFENCGFEIERFGKNFYKILSVPPWLDFADAENFVRDFVEVAREGGASPRVRSLSAEHFARSAVRRIGAAAFECTSERAFGLLSDLMKCPSHLTSPDGKPTLRELSAAELSRMFGR